MSHLDSKCLKVSSQWIPLDVITVRQAFSDAAAGACHFLQFIEGYPVPTSLDDWLKIEPTEDQDYVTTSKLHEIKRILVPRVSISIHYARPKPKDRRPTPENLLKRYGHKDAITGKPLDRKRFSREHVTPRSKGGTNGWENVVPMDRDLNSRRGNREYADAGLKAPKILPAPAPLLPINTIVNTEGYPEWDMFQIPRAENS